jgi:hypothetical protein
MRSAASLLRSVLAAMGLAAVLTLLLQPVCAAYESALQPDDGAACCLEMQPDALVAAPSLQSEKAVAAVLALAPLIPRMALAPMTVSGRLAPWKAPPPQSPSYHARSARIQR